MTEIYFPQWQKMTKEEQDGYKKSFAENNRIKSQINWNKFECYCGWYGFFKEEGICLSCVGTYEGV